MKGKGKTARVSAAGTATPRASAPVGNGGTAGSAPGAGAPGSASPSVDTRAVRPPGDPFWSEEHLSDMAEWYSRDIDENRVHTRAEFDALLERFGTPEGMQQKIEDLLRWRGMGEEKISAFRRAHSPQAFASGIFARLWRDDFVANKPDVRDALGEASVLVGEAVGGTNVARNRDPGESFLAWHSSYSFKVDPDCAWALMRRNAQGFGHPPDEGPEVLGEHVGWDGSRPVPLPLLARRSEWSSEEDLRDFLDEELDGLGYSVEEIKRAADHAHGRRHLWPDERGG